ncbi:MAG: type II secretion system F family protein [Armatimonadota bacterium]
MHDDSAVAHDQNGLPHNNKTLLKQFSQQFADLIDNGNSIVHSLFEIEHEHRDLGLKRVVRSVRSDVELGANLADAMAKHNHFFSDYYIQQVREGEKGDLRVVIRRLSSS